MTWFNAYPDPQTTLTGNPIAPVDGDAEDVASRGTQLAELADMMSNSASLIQRLVDDGADMEGAAIDKLRESAGQVGGDLALAASLYEVVAPYITNYASALATAQGSLNPSAATLAELWAQYAALATEADDAQGAVGDEPEDDAEPEELTAYRQRTRDASGASASADAALDAWEAEAARYDTSWNTWHDAFMTAANGITEGTTDAIADTADDDWRGFLNAASEFLMWAGIVLAVLAIVIGGPIIAALALIVGVLALIVVICQMPSGDADGWDLAFAIVGVIPFGAAAEGFTAFRGGSGPFLSQLGEGGGSLVRNMFDVVPASGNSRLVGDFAQAFSDDGARWVLGLQSGTDFFSTMNTLGPQLAGATDFASELFTGRGADFWEVVGDLDVPDSIAVVVGAVGTAVQTGLTFSEPWR